MIIFYWQPWIETSVISFPCLGWKGHQVLGDMGVVIPKAVFIVSDIRYRGNHTHVMFSLN